MGKLFFGIIACTLLLRTPSLAQDTITVMQYNLLNYNNYTSYCTTVNNNVVNKDAYLQAIIGYVLPDIFTVVEMNESTTSIDRLLNNVMNADSRTNYARASRTNYSSSDIVNMLYYNTDKLTLYSQNTLPTSIRDINFYRLFYKDPDLAITHDTSWITCIVMHLKAGGYPEDITERAAEVSTLMNYLNSLNTPDNYLVMGDFNVYTSSEACFQNLINHSNANIRFYDPVNRVGNWNNNGSFADVHTQSTHTADNGCMATGGMDDRFDFVLSSMSILSGTKNVKYISGSYHALAQDGDHYNSSLLDSPTIPGVPTEVVNALYNNSDHLPVIMQLLIGQELGVFEYGIPGFNVDKLYFIDGMMKCECIASAQGSLNLDVLNVTGQLVFNATVNVNSGWNNISLSIPDLDCGVYLLRMSDISGNSYVQRFSAF